MKSYLLIGILFGMMLLAGCPGTPEPAPGSDRDEHGCIPSAGYSWCEEKQKCYRPWEENCTEQQVLGGDRDAHGCIPSAGYSWCEATQKCYRPWEEECAAGEAPECVTVADCGLGAASCVSGKCSQYDEHGCVPDGGYSWCESLGECIRPWETECPEGQMVGNDRDAHGCIGSAGYSWCEATQKCYRPWEENCTSAGGETAIEKKARTFCGQENIEKVYVCGEYIRTVATLIGGGSSIYDASGNKLSDCPMVNPEYFDATCKKVLMENYCEEKEIC